MGFMTRNTDKLNERETYRQLMGRAAQCGYRINKVVYRGYGAPERLQQMHDQAIEARTRPARRTGRRHRHAERQVEWAGDETDVTRAIANKMPTSGRSWHDVERTSRSPSQTRAAPGRAAGPSDPRGGRPLARRVGPGPGG